MTNLVRQHSIEWTGTMTNQVRQHSSEGVNKFVNVPVSLRPALLPSFNNSTNHKIRDPAPYSARGLNIWLSKLNWPFFKSNSVGLRN